jgi:hypothetical protein
MTADGGGGAGSVASGAASTLKGLLQDIRGHFSTPDDFEDYQRVIFAFLAGKFGHQQLQQALGHLLGDHGILVHVHNSLTVHLLQLCDDSEQRALEALKRELGDSIAAMTSTSSTTASLKITFSRAIIEALKPAELHKRFLTLEDKRELYETKLKMKQLHGKEQQLLQHQRQQRQSKVPRLPVDLNNLQYYNYPLSLDVLKTLPTLDYLKKRLALHASSKGLSLFDEYEAAMSNLNTAGSAVLPELSYSNTISKTGSLEYFLSAWTRGLDKAPALAPSVSLDPSPVAKERRVA